MPPTGCVRLGDGTDESRAPHAGGARRALAATRRRCSRPTRVDGRGRRERARPALVRAARRLARRDRAGARTRPASTLPAARAFRSTGKRGRAQRAHGLPAGRDAAPAARHPGRRLVSATQPTVARRRARARARAWAVLAERARPRGAGAVGVRPRHRARRDRADGDGLEVVLTPTYSGCPATEVIERRACVDALAARRPRPGDASATQRAPAWTTDWISAEGRAQAARLRHRAAAARAGSRRGAAMRFMRVARPAQRCACPRCGSGDTERLSAFGSTACKALYRCLACREPFEHFKPI